MDTTIDLKPLQDLGLSETEALVYAYLVETTPTTGYRISHAIGKPTANTYKAIASLAQSGAVQVDEGENRLVRAVPPSELLSRLERRFNRSRDRAAEALERLSHDQSEEGVYSLRDVDQVLERARSMLDRAERIVLLDVFPRVVAELADAMARTAARGVRVVAKTYEPAQLSGVEVVMPADPERVFALWPGQQLTLVRDAEEHLIGLLDDGLTLVRQAVWSNSLYLSCMHHNYVAAELQAAAVHQVPVDAKGTASVESPAVGISLLSSSAPGLAKLSARAKRMDPSTPGR